MNISCQYPAIIFKHCSSLTAPRFCVERNIDANSKIDLKWHTTFHAFIYLYVICIPTPYSSLLLFPLNLVAAWIFSRSLFLAIQWIIKFTISKKFANMKDNENILLYLASLNVESFKVRYLKALPVVSTLTRFSMSLSFISKCSNKILLDSTNDGLWTSLQGSNNVRSGQSPCLIHEFGKRSFG